MKSWLAASALFLLALLQEASAQEPVAEIPYRMDYGGAITVSVTIDGRGAYDFIIDTGATLTLADEIKQVVKESNTVKLQSRENRRNHPAPAAALILPQMWTHHFQRRLFKAGRLQP